MTTQQYSNVFISISSVYIKCMEAIALHLWPHRADLRQRAVNVCIPRYQPMRISLPIVGGARHQMCIYCSYTPIKATRVIRDASSYYRRGGSAFRKARQRVRFRHGRGRKTKNGREENPLRFVKRFCSPVVAK